MAAEPVSLRAHLGKHFHLPKGIPFTEILDAHYYSQDRDRFFVTIDGRFCRVWKLETYAADVLSEQDRASISDALGKVFNQFPEDSSGQYIRYTHRHVYPLLDYYIKDSQADAFGQDLVRAFVERQIEGAKHGFFGGVSQNDIKDATQELLSEGALDANVRESLIENIERTVTTGRYAFVSESYLVFMYTPRWATTGHMVQSNLKKGLAALGLYEIEGEYQRVFNAEKARFLQFATRIESTAAAFGFQPGRLGAQALLNVLYRELNPIRSLTSGAPEYRQDFTIREQLEIVRREGLPNIADHVTFSNLETQPDGWNIDGMHYKATSAKVLPKNISPGMLFDVIRQIDGENWVVMNFSVPRQSGIRMLLRLRRTTLNSKITDHEFFKGDELLKREKQEDIDYAVHKTNVENIDRQNIIDVSLHIVVKNQDEDAARAASDQLSDLLWSAGVKETNRGDAIIHQCLPLNYRTSTHPYIARNLRCLTENAGDLAPHFTAFAGIDSPGMLVNNSQGMPIFIDQFATRAAHALVVGGTGSGKSYAFNNILMQLRKYRAKMFLVDKGGSYESQCVSTGGSYVNLVLDDSDGITPTNINPFYTEPGETLSNTDLEFMRDILVAMVQSGTKDPVTKLDSSLLLNAVQEVFAQKAPDAQVHLGHIHSYLTEKCGDEGKLLARRFSEYTAGSIYGKMFDGDLNMNWDADMIVFETQRVASSAAMPVIMMALFYQVNKYCKFRDPDRKKVFAVDEAWAALADPTAATAVAGFYREMRKYKTAVILISQTIADFAKLVAADQSSQGGILENTRHFHLLACSAADHSLAKKLLNLTDEEVNAWASVASLPPFFSEWFYRMLTDKDVPYSGKVRLYSNPLALWTATTTPDDRKLRQDRVNELMKALAPAEARRVALTELAKQYPFGYLHHKRQMESV